MIMVNAEKEPNYHFIIYFNLQHTMTVSGKMDCQKDMVG